jgi:predicted cobalt transporter CbtA
MTAAICSASPATEDFLNMAGHLLLRGMLVGVLAGLLAFGFARVLGEPPVDRAIAFEEQMSHAKGEAHEHEVELVSRGTQSGIGLATAAILYGAAIGGIFSLVFAYVYGRFGQLGARSTAALLAVAAFSTVALIPLIKYPANPPAVGNPDTIGPRTGLFLIMLVIAVIAAIGAFAIARSLWAKLGGWNAALTGSALFLLTIVVAQLSLPAISEVPEQFPADVLWQFRVAVLGMQFVLWATIGLAFGVLAERLLAESSSGLR